MINPSKIPIYPPTPPNLTFSLCFKAPHPLVQSLYAFCYSQVCPWLCLIQTTISLTARLDPLSLSLPTMVTTQSVPNYWLAILVILRTLCSGKVSAPLWIPFHHRAKIKSSSPQVGGWIDSPKSGVRHSARWRRNGSGIMRGLGLGLGRSTNTGTDHTGWGHLKPLSSPSHVPTHLPGSSSPVSEPKF